MRIFDYFLNLNWHGDGSKISDGSRISELIDKGKVYGFKVPTYYGRTLGRKLNSQFVYLIFYFFILHVPETLIQYPV